MYDNRFILILYQKVYTANIGKKFDNDKGLCYLEYIKFILSEHGARQGLNREVGSRPTRSRHCIGEQFHLRPLRQSSWEGLDSEEPEPGELPCLKITDFTHE